MQNEKTAVPVLELNEVTKTYGTGRAAVKAVEGVSLSIAAGEVVVIMGPSGSGKTTVLSISGALLSPTSGSVWVAGKELNRLGARELSRTRLRHIGFVFQSFNLLSSLTAIENAMVPMTLAGVPKREARERAKKLLSELGLGERLTHYPNELSGGEKQRVAVGRSVANNPQLILADEPTGNLDSKSGHFVAELLRNIAKEQGKGIVIVSHDMRIVDIADRILWLEDGKLRAETGGSFATDPVCKMRVQIADAAGFHDYKNERYYFDSLRCLEQFKAEPEKYLIGRPVE
ncbi:MAG: ATP-binding cassette domain-containing protein [Actinomycetota bacterium]|nr:ATP-binding cassette domain-containing protein [Actinomycetota bacterium]